MEGMDFPEALLHLGKKCGVEVKRFATTDGNVKQRFFHIHELAVSFYKKVLYDSSIAQTARDYLSNRGMTPELIETFGLGFAPDDWSKLSDALLKRGFSETELVSSGLSLKKKSGSGVIDRFRSRIMVPLRDQHGNTVGFTGRKLPGTDTSMGKYVNSPETPIYHKGRLVFGLDLAKRAIKEQTCAIIVEGNLDVVASHKAGVKNVVASSGTALTQDQLELLKRYTDTVVFCFDRDVAGLVAAKKGVTIARTLGLDVRAISLPSDVKDPDDLVQKNPDAWRALANSSIPFMQFLFDRVLANRDITNIDHKRTISHELLPAIGEIVDVVEREHWLQKLSALLNIDVAMLRGVIGDGGRKGEWRREKGEVGKKNNIIEKLSKKNRIVLVLVGAALNDETCRAQAIKGIEQTIFDREDLAALYNFLKKTYTDNNVTADQKSFFLHARALLQNHPEQERLISLLDQSSLMAEQAFENCAPSAVPSQLKNLIETLREIDLQHKRSMLAQKLHKAEDAGDAEAVKKLLAEL
jgi:DNA primase